MSVRSVLAPSGGDWHLLAVATKRLSMRGRTTGATSARAGKPATRPRPTGRSKQASRSPAKSAEEVPAQGGPVALMEVPRGYDAWLSKLKESIRSARQRATLAVNRELVALYWRIGTTSSSDRAERAGARK